jgi:predicted DsbA family dithiol-disulfide isomerase
MTTRSFSVTFDYLCPFARNGHEHVLSGLRDGADWDVAFRPFSLNQVHVPEGESAIWERPDEGSGLLALQYGIAARDTQPDAFLDVHLALFAARHDKGLRINEPDVVLDAVRDAGADVDALTDEVRSGQPLKTIQAEHDESVERWRVFGVPTFIADDQAVFIRYMHRAGQGLDSTQTVERVLDYLTEWTDLNEFKRTRIPR